MKLLELQASRYKSLREVTIAFGDLNVFIGPNGSGKSTILDALKFLHEGLCARDFRVAVRDRGGIRFLVWNGEQGPQQVQLRVRFKEAGQDTHYTWSIILTPERRGFSVKETVTTEQAGSGSTPLLEVDQGSGWWASEAGHRVRIEQGPRTCALAAAATDAGFPARHLSHHILEWGFFDPNLFALRGSRQGEEPERLDGEARNLAERLFRLQETSPQAFDRIAEATKSVIGTPDRLESVEEDDKFHLHLYEEGLEHPVSQSRASSGTLRVLALLTGVLEEPGRRIVAIEEPENNVHPAALGDFVQYLVEASRRVQLLITTHSPIVLNFLEDPNAVSVVRRDDGHGTQVVPERNAQGVTEALEASGFSLGEFHETKGFGR